MITSSKTKTSKQNSIVIDNDDKIYLLCLQFVDDEFHKEWFKFEHSEFVMDTIKENIDDIDLSESFILSTEMKLKNSISVYDFIKIYQNTYNDEDYIDLEQYSNEDSNVEIDENFRSNKNILYITDMLSGNNNRSISI